MPKQSIVAFELTRSDGSKSVAGAPDLGVLSFVLSASGRLGPASQGTRGGANRVDIGLRLGGLTSRAREYENEHLVWHRSKTEIGDVITIEIVETDKADDPTSRRRKNTGRARVALPLRRRRARRRRGAYMRRHSTFPPHHDD